ncbi:hypothetical protein V6N11_024445 [Hibiscus sabdariffa]|uniref:Uncharacterized protein n=1 Tax=Hibiscus sabdariffa TaxID=183260 RepID=A0ABR2QML9_9ROSI
MEAAQESTLSLEAVRESTSSMEAAQEPTPLLEAVCESISSMEAAQEPTPSLEAVREPISSMEAVQEPTYSVEAGQEPISLEEAVCEPASLQKSVQRSTLGRVPIVYHRRAKSASGTLNLGDSASQSGVCQQLGDSASQLGMCQQPSIIEQGIGSFSASDHVTNSIQGQPSCSAASSSTSSSLQKAVKRCLWSSLQDFKKLMKMEMF